MASAAHKLGRREATEEVVEEIIRSAAPEATNET
jgi:hypothetical protein